MLRCVKDGVTTMKHGHQETRNACLIWSDESSFTLSPTSGRVYVWRTPKDVYNPECLVPRVTHGGGSVLVWAAISWNSVSPIVTLFGQITAREYINMLDDQVHPMI
jgi:hypothetical protein